MSKKQWSCESVSREAHAVSDVELRQRLAEVFVLLVKERSQQQKDLPAFSKDHVLIEQQVPNTSDEKKGA